MTTTKDDGVKVMALKCVRHGCLYREIEDLDDLDNVYCSEGLTPLISALDEADAVDGLCGYLGFCPARDTTIEGAKTCGSKCHAHADKLRGLR